MRVMVGVVSDQPDSVRRWLLGKRIQTLAAMPDQQPAQHAAWMAEGLSQLTPENRALMMSTQMSVLAQADANTRRRIMAAMDRATERGSS